VTLVHSALSCAISTSGWVTLIIASLPLVVPYTYCVVCCFMQQFTSLQEVQVTLVEGTKMCSAAGSVTRVSNPLYHLFSQRPYVNNSSSTMV
jgi:type III secretory pathway component EscS